MSQGWLAHQADRLWFCSNEECVYAIRGPNTSSGRKLSMRAAACVCLYDESLALSVDNVGCGELDSAVGRDFAVRVTPTRARPGRHIGPERT